MSWQDQMLFHSPSQDHLSWTNSCCGTPEETTIFSEEPPYRESKKLNLTSQLTSDPKGVDVPLSSHSLICKPVKLVSSIAIEDDGG